MQNKRVVKNKFYYFYSRSVRGKKNTNPEGRLQEHTDPNLNYVYGDSQCSLIEYVLDDDVLPLY